MKAFPPGARARLCAIALAWVLAAVAAGPARADDALPPAVRAALAEADVPPEAFAGIALPLGHRAPAWRVRAGQPMQPASTLKVLTSIVALDRLGPNHRSFTELRSAAPVDGGVLRGDLVLRGGADPELGVAQFWALLMELRALGVAEIAGDLVVDRTLFRPARMDLGVPPFDETPEFPYNVIPDALQLAGALLRIDLDSSGGEVRARLVPPLPGIGVTSRMSLTDRRCEDWDEDWQPARVQRAGERIDIELQGGFPRQPRQGDAGEAGAGCRVRAQLQLVDRQELTERLFRSLWQDLGGRFGGRVREAVDGAPARGTRVLVRRESRPWGEVLRNLNKRSDNPEARLLFLSLGVPAMAAEPGTDTAELSARVVRDWLAARGIDAAGLVLDNGSGLSRRERITPLTLARALQEAWHERYAPDLLMSLPVVGSETARTLKDSPAAGWARMKGGTLRNVVSLAGYVNDADGRPWVLAMMINHERAQRVRRALFEMVDVVARGGPHPRRPGIGPQGEGP